MRIHTRFLASFVCLGLSAGAGWADGAVPNTMPVEAFDGMQFVDARGCVFDRAGGGWVLASPQPVCLPNARKTRRSQPLPQGATKRVRIGPLSAPTEIAEARAIRPPRGFEAAWDDGRLNPLKAVGTRHGKAHMDVVWSKTTPRFEIDPATGERVR